MCRTSSHAIKMLWSWQLMSIVNNWWRVGNEYTGKKSKETEYIDPVNFIIISAYTRYNLYAHKQQRNSVHGRDSPQLSRRFVNLMRGCYGGWFTYTQMARQNTVASLFPSWAQCYFQRRIMKAIYRTQSNLPVVLLFWDRSSYLPDQVKYELIYLFSQHFPILVGEEGCSSYDYGSSLGEKYVLAVHGQSTQ